MGGEMDEIKGRIKEAVGDLTGDDDLKAKGKIDKLTGSAKDLVDEVADTLKGD